MPKALQAPGGRGRSAARQVPGWLAPQTYRELSLQGPSSPNPLTQVAPCERWETHSRVLGTECRPLPSTRTCRARPLDQLWWTNMAQIFRRRRPCAGRWRESTGSPTTRLTVVPLSHAAPSLAVGTSSPAAITAERAAGSCVRPALSARYTPSQCAPFGLLAAYS